MLLSSLLFVPIIGIFLISGIISFDPNEKIPVTNNSASKYSDVQIKVNTYYKKIALLTSIVNLVISLVIYLLFDFTNNQFQFVQ